MTKRDILSISFKVLGVVCLIYAAAMLPAIGIYIGSTVNKSSILGNPYWALALAVASWASVVAIAVFLLRRGDWMAERLVPTDSPVSTTVTDVRQWERSAFILSVKVIGVVCLTKGLPQLVNGLVDVARRGGPAPGRFWYLTHRFVGPIVLLALGAYLISGGKHLVRFAFGHPEDMPALDDTDRDEPH
jgi:hypothetical protein